MWCRHKFYPDFLLSLLTSGFLKCMANGNTFRSLVLTYVRWIKKFLYEKVLEGRSYRLLHPWVGIVNRSQADINKNVDMVLARRKEQDYFATSPEYGHLSSKMGSEYLAKLLSKVYFLCLVCVQRFSWMKVCYHLDEFYFYYFSTWSLLSEQKYRVSQIWLTKAFMNLNPRWTTSVGLLLLMKGWVASITWTLFLNEH